MPFKYEAVVPWGRSFDEYQRMFALTEDDLNSSVVGCGDGPAAFNVAMFHGGGRAVSCDPLYQLAADQIRARIDATYENVIAQTHRNQDQFVWNSIKSIDELGRVRMMAMQKFLADYESGRRSGRYVVAELPNLPFRFGAFDIAVCSHFLFLYSDVLSLEFHRHAIEEMCRVAREARIFPLLTYNAEPSPFVMPLLDSLAAGGYTASIESVPYEFQRGGNKMLRVRRAEQVMIPSSAI